MKKLILLAAIIPAMWACKKNNKDSNNPADNAKPVVNEFKINEEYPEAYAVANEEMHVDMKVSDDRAIGEIRLNIHGNFDGHSHRTSAAEFEFDTIIDLKNSPRKEYNGHIHIDLPANTKAGTYDALLYVTDVAGNEAEFKEIELTITSPTAPVITITSPDINNEIEVEQGASFTLLGTITDDTGLDSVYIAVIHEEEDEHDDHNHRKADEDPLFEIKDGNASGTLYSIDQIVNVGAAEVGHYKLIIKAFDTDGNLTVATGEVHVEPAARK